MESAVLACEAPTAGADAAAAPGARGEGDGGAGDVVMLRRSAIAACLTCPLCGRLFRDAATITECLHTFCRKCISEEFINKEVCCCPICSIDLGCAPLEKLRIDHSLQYVRSKVCPFKKQKVEVPEVTSPITSPIKTKERSLSSLTKHAPQMSMQKCLTKRRTKASCLRKLPLYEAPPLSTVLRQAHRSLDDAAEAFQREWAELKAERQRLEERKNQLDEVESRQSSTERRLGEALKALSEREASAKTLESNLTHLRDSIEAREGWVRAKEAELTEQSERLRSEQAALDRQAQEAAQKAVEAIREEQRAGLQRISAWAGEVSTALVPLGMSPIQVAVPPTSLSDALPVLDSAAERFRRLSYAFGAQLEAEGRELCRVVTEHILVCFRSHSPDLSLEPVIMGPVAAAEDAARESVNDAVEIVAARFQREPVDDA